MAKLTWSHPKSDPGEIIAAYCRLLPPGIEAWAGIDGARVHFYTVLEGNPDAEDEVYAAELALVDQVGSESVEFDVYPDIGAIKSRLKELVPVHTRSD